MLDDRSVSARCLVTYGLWLASVAVWGLSWILNVDDLGRLAIIVCAGAVTATIKGMFVEQHERIKNALAITSAIEREFVRPIR